MSIKIINNTIKVQDGLESAIKRGLEAIGAVAEGYAKDECPVDTGRLQNSITHKTEGKSAYIGTNVEYAPYVELGTRKMPPRPYLRPAATQHNAEYKELLEESMKNA